MRLVAIVLLGFAVRLIGLAQLGDLEFDEIVSVRYASLPVDELLPRLAGALFEHPPAFYLALGGWRALAGASDAGARLFSVIPGTLTVPLAYAAGRRLFDRPAGTLAALLVAVAPLPIFYSREARMYALLACLALAGCWLLVRALAAPRRAGTWLAYAAVSGLAAYVHYAGAILLAAQAGAVLARHRRRAEVVRPLAVAVAAPVLLALPWLFASSGARASLPALAAANLRDAPSALWAAWTDLAAGPLLAESANRPYGTSVLAGVAATALLLLAVAGFGRIRAGRVVTGATLLAGLAGLLFAVALGKPVQGRYLLLVAPLVYVCAAAGLLGAAGRVRGERAALGAGIRPSSFVMPTHRTAAVLGVVGLLCGFAPFWRAYYGGYTRADYSSVTREIAAAERPGDGLLLTGPWQAWYFDYYYAGRLEHEVLPRDAPPALDPAAAAARLEQLAAAHRRLWFVQAGLAQADPTNFVERWLLRHAWVARREAHRSAVLSLNALDPPRATRPLVPVIFDRRLRLAGGWVDADEVPAGDVVRVTLELEALQPAAGDLKASLRLVGSDGQRVATDFDLVDREGEGAEPAPAWPAGHRATIRRGIWVPPALGPQPYDVRLVVYHPATLAALPPEMAVTSTVPGAPGAPVAAGGEATVGSVFVTQPLAGGAARRPAPPAARRFGGGDDFDTIDFIGVRWGQRNPSQAPLAFDLAWRLAGASGTEHRSTTAVVDQRGRTWLEETRPLFGGAFAMHDWREGETLVERRSLDLTTLPAGRYRILVGLEDARGRRLPLATQATALEMTSLDLPYRRPLTERALGLLGRLLSPLRQR